MLQVRRNDHRQHMQKIVESMLFPLNFVPCRCLNPFPRYQRSKFSHKSNGSSGGGSVYSPTRGGVKKRQSDVKKLALSLHDDSSRNNHPIRKKQKPFERAGFSLSNKFHYDNSNNFEMITIEKLPNFNAISLRFSRCT